MKWNIVFDMGNVLYDFDYRKAHAGLVPYMNMDYDTFNREIVHSENKKRCDCGQDSPQQLYEWIVARHGLRCDFATFATAWKSIFTEVPDMIELGIALKAKYGVYVLSTTDPLHMDQQINHTRLLEVTTNLGLSYELGSIKPERRIYERFLTLFDLEGPSCIFIDDLEENARGAAQVGMKWIHHRSPQETMQILAENYGVTP